MCEVSGLRSRISVCEGKPFGRGDMSVARDDGAEAEVGSPNDDDDDDGAGGEPPAATVPALAVVAV